MPKTLKLLGLKKTRLMSSVQKLSHSGAKLLVLFLKKKLTVFGLLTLIVIALMAIFVPLLSPYSFAEQTGNFNTPPTASNWFGTDNLSRDIFVRIWVGARISLFIGLAAALIDLVIGASWGAISGVLGGRVDSIMMRIADILTAIPYLLVVVMLLVVMDNGLLPMIVALSITGWVRMARIVRGEVL